MKLSKSILKKVIKEELNSFLSEELTDKEEKKKKKLEKKKKKMEKKLDKLEHK